MVYKPARIDFTAAQIKKAVNGQPIRFKAAQVGKGDKVILLHPSTHAMYKKAVMKGKGLTITISPGEILSTVESDMDGTGFFGDIYKKLKSGYKWVKKNIIDTDVYQKAIKPLVRKGVDALASMASSYAPEAAPLITAGVNTIGSKTGAFGLEKEVEAMEALPVMRKHRKRSMEGRSFRIAS
jgi:hypothetical protein